jgi:hypothetical protein
MTTRTDRQHETDIAVLSSLPPSDAFLVPDKILKATARRCLPFAPTQAELDEAVRYADEHGRICGIHTETGIKWALTEVGRLWLSQNN